MQRMTTLVVSVLALSALLGGTAMASENQPPLADAGLDQSVERAMTVQLDANGSRDPDGTIEDVEWSIETPDGTTRTPDCPTCVQTTFSPAETGQYNVTIAITDDDGASRSDTLHVDVVAAGGPSVSVSAPPAVPVGLRRNLTANATAGDADLRTLAWVVNGTAQNQTRLTGANGTSTITYTFNDSGSVAVRAVAYDAAGRRDAANRTVRVAGSSGSSGGGGGGGGNGCPGGSGNYYVDGQNQGCTSAALTVDDTIVDTDGRDGLWLYVDSELTKIIEEDNMNKYSEDGYGGTFSKETINEQKREMRQKRQKANNRGSSDDDNDSGSNSDDDSHNFANTRPDSSVPNNLMNPDGRSDDDSASLPNEPSVDNNPFGNSDNDDDSSLSNDGSDTDGSGNSNNGDSRDSDDSSDGNDGGLFDGGLFSGSDSDDDDDGGDDDSGDDGGGGWSFW
ncbi:PKD domain-containing protein [Haloarcula japonica]|uniref:PKD domain-containing protein n=1 Tax=Haloarcula japonica TaxID=29282 RepID=UPI0039F6DB96